MSTNRESSLQWKKEFELRCSSSEFFSALEQESERVDSEAAELLLWLKTKKHSRFQHTSNGRGEFAISPVNGGNFFQGKVALRGFIQAKSRKGLHLEAHIAPKPDWRRGFALAVAAAIPLIFLILYLLGKFDPSALPWHENAIPLGIGIVLPAFFLTVALTSSPAEQEARALIAFFEKLVAPYAVAADTMDRDADTRDP